MASGSNSTVLTNPNGGKYNLLISWNENSTSIENNTSNITVTAKLTKNNSRFEVNNAGVLKAYWHDDKTNSDTEFASLAVTELGYKSTERVASGTKNMTHKDDGTLNGYAYASWTRNSSYGGYVPTSGTCRAPSSGTTALTTIARKATIKSAPNFNDEDSPTITYENKAGNSVSSLQACISLAGSTDDIVYRDIPKTGTSYQFNLTTAERNVLRNATTTSNSRTVKFFVKTIIGSNTFYDTADKTFSIVNANPTFTNYTFHDGNSTTTAITGNNQWIIQNKSSLVVDIASANKAVANKGASMSSYVYEISSYSGSANYTTSNLSKTIGAINANANQNLKVTAKDSRGNSTAVSKTVNIVPYATPVLNVSATRLNNFENNTTIKISGSASLMKVNNVVKNAVNATNGVQYRKKVSSTSTWESWVNVSSSYNTSTGAVTVSDFIISLDNQQAWDFQFKLTDKLETKTVSITVSQGQPQFFIGADGRVSVGGLPTRTKPTTDLGLLQVHGNIYMDSDFVTRDGWSRQVYRTLHNGGATAIPANANLDSKTYCQVGKYICSSSSTAATVSNNPCGNAFTMEVRNLLGEGTIDLDGTWKYIERVLRCGTGNEIYRQYCYIGGTAGTISYGNWQKYDFHDNRAQGGVWSSFYFDNIVGDTTATVYTKKGTTLSLLRGNGGIVLCCSGGAASINMARCSWGQSYSTRINGNYGAHGLAASSKIYTRYLGALVNNSSAGVGEYTSTAGTGTPAYGDLASTMSGTRSGSYCSMTMLRTKGTSRWEMQGNVSSEGVATSMDFDAHITAYNNNYIPGTYQRGATNNNTSTSWCLFEVFEP